ncbi:hypothetical protein ACJJTC_005721 [Scirpophaga incertulas]
MNPKVIPLDLLIGLIDGELLTQCLEQVAAYIQSNSTDMCFPDVSPYLEAFLIRVIQDVTNFESLLNILEEQHKNLAKQIIKSLRDNKKIFKVTYCYDTHSFKSTLIFRKKYPTETSLEASLASNFRNMCQDDNDPPHCDPIYQHMTIILRFLKDKTRRSLEFPEMAFVECERIANLIRQRDEYSSPMYKLMWDEIDALSSTVEIKPSFLYMSNDVVRLTLEKVSRNKTEAEKKPTSPKSYIVVAPKVNSAPSTSRCFQNGTTPKISKAQKVIEKKTNMVKSLDRVFIVKSLENIYSFIEKNEKGVSFLNATESQCKFLLSACAMARNPKVYDAFDDDSKKYLSKICEALKENTMFNIKTHLDKMQKDRLRTVIITRVPKEMPKATSATDFDTGERKPNKKLSVKPSTATSLPPEDLSKPEPSDKRNKEENEGIKKRSLSLPRNGDIEKASDGNKLQYNLPSFTRKARLVAAMSVPLKSDIAERMMSQMGWEGGPLGVRGDGITEPLMPALHLKAGAGLGHVPPESESVANREKQRQHASRFRYHLLQQVLTLLTTESNEHEVKYNHALTKSDKNLIKRLLGTLSNRSLTCPDEMCAEVLGRIMRVLDRQPDLKISSIMSDPKCVTLKKVVSTMTQTPQAPSVAARPPADLPTTRIKQKCNELPLHLNREWNALVGHIQNPQYAVRNAVKFGHKVAVLHKILLFIRGNKAEDKIISEYPLNTQQIDYIKEVIAKLNQKCKPSYPSPIENCIVNEMLLTVRHMLEVIFETKNNIVLRKLSYIPKIATEVNGDSVVVNNGVEVQAKIYVENENIHEPELGGSRAKIEVNDATQQSNIKEVNTNLIEANEAKARIINVLKDSQSLESEIIALEEEILLADTDSDSDSEDDEMSTSSGKRSRTESPNSTKTLKKSRINDQVVCLNITKNGGEVTKAIAKEFQTAIMEKMEFSNEQPLLECLGLKNGTLTYYCHNEIGLLLIAGVTVEKKLLFTQVDNDISTKHKVKFRMNLYVQLDLKKLFTKIECYNFGLSTEKWVVSKVTREADSLEVVLKIDDLSMEYICNAKFCLFAGIDKVRFTILWD